MSNRLRVSLLAVAVLVALPVLSACDTSPNAAAIVGGHRVTTSELQDVVNTSLKDVQVQQALAQPAQGTAGLGGDRAGFTRQTLGRLITDRIISELAVAHSVTATPQEIAAQLTSLEQQAGTLPALQQAAAQQLGIAPSQLNDFLRFTVLQQNLGTALTASLPATHAQLETEYKKDIDSYDQLQIAQIAVAKKALANRLLAKVRANPASFPALAKKYSVDTATKAQGGMVGLVGRSQVVSLLGKASEAKPGTFAVASSQGQFIVLHIIKRVTQPLSAVEGKVKAALFSSQSQTLLSHAITTEGAKLGVHVNPRYGKWDNTTQAVVAAPDPVSTSG